MQKVSVQKQDGLVYIEFAEKQRAVTPGQYAVLYISLENGGYKCIGGGQIDVVIKDGTPLDL